MSPHKGAHCIARPGFRCAKWGEYDEKTDSGIGTSYTYDYLDRLICTEKADGSIEKRLLDMDGNVLKEYDPEMYEPGNPDTPVTGHLYDRRQYLLEDHLLNGGTRKYLRDNNGNLLRTIEPEMYAVRGDAGAGITYEYDACNRVTKITGADGKRIRAYEYDLLGRVIREYDHGNLYATQYRYDLAGNILEKRVPVTTDTETGGALYNVTLYEYDAAGNKILEKRSADTVKEGGLPVHFLEISYTYDRCNRLVRVEDSYGSELNYTYDCLNNRLSESAKINDSVTCMKHYRYDAAGRLSEIIESADPEDLGQEKKDYRKKEVSRTVISYDGNGNITKIVYPNGGTLKRSYDVEDRVTEERITDPKTGMDRVESYTYDKKGNLTKVTGDGHTRSYVYDSMNRIVRSIDEEGNVTRYDYDLNGRPVRLVDADHYEKETDDGAGYTFSYDDDGRLLSITQPSGDILESYAYDDNSRLQAVSDALGRVAGFTYDLTGNRTAVYGSRTDTALQSFRRDSLGNVTSTTDGEGNRTDFTLDRWGRITEVVRADGSVEHYEYDYAGNVTATTDGNGGVISYAFNSMNRLKRITDQEGNSEHFVYDREGNETVHTERSGKKVTSEFGSFGLRISEQADDGETNHFAYDSRGRLKESSNSHVTYRYDHTPTGRIRTRYVNQRPALRYEYTGTGRVSAITDITGKRTEYHYDINGRLSEVCEDGKKIAQYSYLANGLTSKVMFANKITTEYTYDEEQNLAKVITRDKTGRELLVYQYRYDNNGNRLRKKDLIKDRDTVYGYDSMNRLQNVTYPDGERDSFTFDGAGNRIRRERIYGGRQKTDGDIIRFGNPLSTHQNHPSQGRGNGVAESDSYWKEVTEYRYDERNRLLEETLHKVTEGGERSQAFVHTYAYDIDGNLINEESPEEIRNYLYNGFRQTSQVEIIRRTEEAAERKALEQDYQERSIQQNLYDAEGLRYSIIENGEQTGFITNGWDVYTEITEKGEAKKRLIRASSIVASEDYEGIENGEVSSYHYYHGNERNDIELITDETGKIRNQYGYDAFGGIRTARENLPNRYTYNGEIHDRLTSQYYLRARYYSPKAARFTQEDVYRVLFINHVKAS